MNIEDLLSQNESASLEFKESCPDKNEIIALICAFANTSGGDLIIGVKDKNRRVIGIDNELALEIEQRLSSWAVECISPSILPLIRIINHKNKTILSVRIDAGYQKPYRVISGKNSGKVFIRIGSSTRTADNAFEEQLRLQSIGISPDSIPAVGFDKEDLKKEIIGEFLELRQKVRNIPPPSRISDEWLKKMKFAVMVHGKLKPTLGGLLLFNNNPQEIYDFSGLDMARFKGTRAKDFIDKISLSGPLWKLYGKACAFLKKHLLIRAERKAGFRREVLAYPELTFREFMINAICHRVYAHGTGTIKLAIFDDIIEITNPGTLPNGLELEDIGTGISVIRNPIIARVFNEIGLIEGWGTGINLAQQELAAKGLPKAKINLKGFFTQVSSVWRWPKNLSEKELSIVQNTLQKGSINSFDVMKFLDCSERSARNILSLLVKKGLLKKEGTTKGSKYLPI